MKRIILCLISAIAAFGIVSCTPDIEADSFAPKLEMVNEGGQIAIGEDLQLRLYSNHQTVQIMDYGCDDVKKCEEVNEIFNLKANTTLDKGSEKGSFYKVFTIDAKYVDFAESHEGEITLVLYDEAMNTTKSVRAGYSAVAVKQDFTVNILTPTIEDNHDFKFEIQTPKAFKVKEFTMKRTDIAGQDDFIKERPAVSNAVADTKDNRGVAFVSGTSAEYEPNADGKVVVTVDKSNVSIDKEHNGTLHLILANEKTHSEKTFNITYRAIPHQTIKPTRIYVKDSKGVEQDALSVDYYDKTQPEKGKLSFDVCFEPVNAEGGYTISKVSAVGKVTNVEDKPVSQTTYEDEKRGTVTVTGGDTGGEYVMRLTSTADTKVYKDIKIFVRHRVALVLNGSCDKYGDVRTYWNIDEGWHCVPTYLTYDIQTWTGPDDLTSIPEEPHYLWEDCDYRTRQRQMYRINNVVFSTLNTSTDKYGFTLYIDTAPVSLHSKFFWKGARGTVNEEPGSDRYEYSPATSPTVYNYTGLAVNAQYKETSKTSGPLWFTRYYCDVYSWQYGSLISHYYELHDTDFETFSIGAKDIKIDTDKYDVRYVVSMFRATNTALSYDVVKPVTGYPCWWIGVDKTPFATKVIE